MKNAICIQCGTKFTMSDETHKNRLRDGGTFWCPNGHSQYFTANKTSFDKLNIAKQWLLSQREKWRTKRDNYVIGGLRWELYNGKLEVANKVLAKIMS